MKQENKYWVIAFVTAGTVVTLAIALFAILTALFSNVAHGAQPMFEPFERSRYLQVPSQYEREREAKKLIDYQVEQQHEADRALEREREFNRQLERLHRGW